MKHQLAKTQTSSLIDKAIVSAMMIESIIIAFSIREDMFLSVAIGALIVIGLRATKKVKVWKANFDGKLELTTDDVKKSIDWYSRQK